jgi:RNA polymerase sigma factor (sigma-70 family)
MNDARSFDAFDPAALAADAARLRRLAARLVGASDADDVAQATWLAAAEARPVYRVSARAWLAQVLRYKAARGFRAVERRLRAETRAARPEASVASPGDVVERAEVARRLWAHVLALPEPSRRTILWRYFDGLGDAEIARREKTTEGAIRVRASRAVAVLRARLREDEPDGRTALWPLLPVAFGIAVPALRAAAGVVVAALALTTAAYFAFVAGDAERGAPAAASRTSPPQPDAATAAESRDAGIPVPPVAVAAAPYRADVEGPAFRGVVEDEQGRPLADAFVAALPWALADGDAPIDERRVDDAASVARTDSEGRFALAASQADAVATLVARRDDRAPAALRPVRADVPVRIGLGALASFTGFVRDLAERPISGASVVVRDDARGVAVVRRATTGADGGFAFAGAPLAGRRASTTLVDEPSIAVEAPGFLATRVSRSDLTRRADGYATTVYLTRGAPVAGRVVDDATGRPLPDAEVDAVQFSLVRRGSFSVASTTFMETPSGATRTDADGAFRFEGLPAAAPVEGPLGGRPVGASRAARLRVRATGYAPTSLDVDFGAEGVERRVELRLRAGGRVVGRIVEPGGRPLPGCVLTWAAASPHELRRIDDPGRFAAESSVTDAEGRFTCDAVPIAADGAPTRLYVHPPEVVASFFGGQGAHVCDAFPTSGGVCDLGDVKVLPNWCLTALVAVTDHGGRPIAGARATASGPHGGSGRTGSDGIAAVRLPALGDPAGCPVLVEAPGYGTRVVMIVGEGHAPGYAKVALGPPLSVAGRVTKRDGTPTPATVFVIRAGATHSWGAVRIATATADESGRFEAQGLGPGPWDLEAYAREGRGTVRNVEGDCVIVVESPVPQSRPTSDGQAVRLHVRDAASREPIVGGRAEARSADGRGGRTFREKAPGRYVLDGLPAGEWSIEVSAPRYAPRVIPFTSFGGGETEAAVALAAAGVLRGRVVFAGVETWAGFIVIASGPTTASAPLDPDGAFAIEDLDPESRYELTFTASRAMSEWFVPLDDTPRAPDATGVAGAAAGSAAGAVADAPTVALRRAASIMVNVGGGLGASSAPSASSPAARVELRGISEPWSRTRERVQGIAGFTAPLGDYDVVLTRPDGRVETRRVALTAQGARVDFPPD